MQAWTKKCIGVELASTNRPRRASGRTASRPRPAAGTPAAACRESTRRAGRCRSAARWRPTTRFPSIVGQTPLCSAVDDRLVVDRAGLLDDELQQLPDRPGLGRVVVDVELVAAVALQVLGDEQRVAVRRRDRRPVAAAEDPVHVLRRRPCSGTRSASSRRSRRTGTSGCSSPGRAPSPARRRPPTACRR